MAGPILGGLILTLADWRWIFFINVPIGLFGAIWGYRALREMSIRKKGERFDGVGALSFSLGLTALLIALTLGIQYSFTSTPIVVLFCVFLAGYGILPVVGTPRNEPGARPFACSTTASTTSRCCRP